MLESHLSKNLGNKKVKTFFKEEIEPQEILLDKLAEKKEREIGISEKKLEVPLLRIVLEGFLIFSLILFFILFLRTIQFQIAEGKNWQKLAEKNKYILEDIQAQRGVIYDRNGEQLVFNDLKFFLVSDKEKIPKGVERERLIENLAQILKKKKEEIEKEIDSFYYQIEDFQELIILETKIDELKGFKILKKTIREYKDESLSHILGYLGKINSDELKEETEFYSIDDYLGREGLERSYEKTLRKIPGKFRIEKDVKGNVVSKEIISQPKSGKSLILNLDFELQKKIREELERQINSIGSKTGAAIAIDPRNGAILAMVSIPTFNSNIFSQGDLKAIEFLFEDKEKPLLNRAISGQYLLGSTIKPLIATAALEEKIIDPKTKIYDQGFIEIPHRYNPEIVYTFEDWRPHGFVDLRKAIAESCNVYFYTIGGGYGEINGLGPSRIKKYLQIFGLGQIPKIDLPIPEYASGLVPDPEWKKREKGEGWWDGDTYNLSIGQGYILATPLQIAQAFSVIANGGKFYKAHLVSKIVDENKNLIEEIKPEIIRENFISQENLKLVREGMRDAVTGRNAPHASAVLLNSLPVTAAAKTGTAQIGGDFYNNWLAVFAPYENPEIVLVILIEKVKELRQAVLPVAKNILEWYFSK